MIATQYVYPPIPLRQFDWAAWVDSELCCSECPLTTGYGPTELDAIFDLLEQKQA